MFLRLQGALVFNGKCKFPGKFRHFGAQKQDNGTGNAISPRENSVSAAIVLFLYPKMFKFPGGFTFTIASKRFSWKIECVKCPIKIGGNCVVNVADVTMLKIGGF